MSALHLPYGLENLPSDLARVVSAWSDLPEALRSGILAMVAAASNPSGGR
ncbi:MAG: hypothetical protein SFX72_13830 [Isosphaeraceae bacterium]|nr:hypothetical protein [Isosphaeraceae bacterium]